MVEKATGSETVEEAFDLSQPLEAQIEAAEDTKKTKFQVINNPLCLFLRVPSLCVSGDQYYMVINICVISDSI